jgi:hypothetical protein
MKLTEIINRNSWPSIEPVFLQLYFDDKEDILDYETAFGNLKLISPTNSNITLDVSWVKDDSDEEEFVYPSGYYNNPEDYQDGENHMLILDFISWDKWLGMDMDEQSIKNFSEPELISHCLFQMTLYGYNPKEIQETEVKLKDLYNAIGHYKDEE